MENPKKIPYISGNGNPKKASYISGNGNFQYKLEKIKKVLYKNKKYFIFQEKETPKKFLVFSQKKAFLIFWETKTLNKFLYFRKRKP